MSKPKNSLTAEDWLDEALKVLAKEGVKAIAVEPLAKRLGVTKGSFYWHFKNRDMLIAELLKFWEAIEQDYIEDYFQRFPDPIERLKAILTTLVDDDINKYVFLALANGVTDPTFGEAYEKAVNRRLQLFEEIYLSMGIAKSHANRQSFKIYCQYFGLIKMAVDQPSEEYTNEMYEFLKNDLIQSAL